MAGTEKSSNIQKATSGVLWMSAKSILNIILNIATTMILSRMFTPAEFGIVASVMIIISFSSLFWMMGIGPAIVQKKDLTNEDIATGNTLNILFGIVVYIVVFFLSTPLAQFLNIANVSMIWVLSLAFIIQSISSVSESLLQRNMQFKKIALIYLLTESSYAIITIMMAYAGLGVWSLVLGTLISFLIKSTAAMVLSPVRLKPQIRKESAKALLYYGGGHTLSRIFNNLANQGDNIVVTRTLGSEMLGLYSRAYSLLSIPANLIGQVIDSVMFPLLSRHQDNNEKLRFIYSNISVSIMLMTVPISTLSILMSDKIVVFFLSERWLSVNEPFAILMLTLFFRTAYKLSDTLVRSLAAVYRRTIFQIIYASMVIGGAYSGHYFGLAGVAWAVGTAITINYMLMLVLSIRLIKIEVAVFLRMHLPAAFIGIISFAAVKCIYMFIPRTWPDIAVIAVVSILYMVMYSALFAFAAWKHFVPETREFFTAIFKNLMSGFGRRKKRLG